MHTLHKAAILFLILCLQFQAAAAIVMPCAHQSPVDGNPIGCHQTGGNDIPADEKSPISCIKCALNCITGGFQGPAMVRHIALPISNGTIQSPLHPQHFYRFVPEQPQRPPIA